MTEISVAIMGLSRIGTSIGLALKRYNATSEAHTFKISGYDTIGDNVRAAKDLGAVDVTRHRPDDVVRDQALVFMALPYGEAVAAYEMIGHNLRNGAVIIDLSTLKGRSLEAAKKYLPKSAHLVCAAPIINPERLFTNVDTAAHATEDLFDNGMMMMMPSVTCAEEAIKLAHDIAILLGSKPHFFDAGEHDALIAATEVLPTLLGVASFYTLNQGKGWDDIQRLTNPAFGAQTRVLFDMHPDDLVRLWLDSGPNLVRYLNETIKLLTQFRDLVQEKDEDSLTATIDSASQEYQAWITRRHKNTWDQGRVTNNAPTFADSMTNLFGGLFNMGRKRDDKDE